MPIAVKWFSSDMRGAPTISGPAGTIAAFVSQVEAALAQKAEVPA